LLPRYLGPFKVIKLIGKAAVKLSLPPSWHIHPVFHVSLIKVWKGADTPEVSTVEVEGLPEYQVDTILSHKVQSRGRGRSVTLFLVKWKDFGDEHNSWEPESALTAADGLYENLKLTEYWQSLARPPMPTTTHKPANAKTIASKARRLSTKKIVMKITTRSATCRNHDRK
jgi:hypothetical protein